jgi:hypothetical protein
MKQVKQHKYVHTQQNVNMCDGRTALLYLPKGRSSTKTQISEDLSLVTSPRGFGYL